MRFRFQAGRLQRLYTDEEGADQYPSEVVDSFFEAMASIKNAVDERDLYKLKSFHFERLRGKDGKLGLRSIRLNRQWRLILKIDRDKDGKLILIIDITNHYKK